MSPQAFGFFSCFFSFSFFLYMQIIIISPSQSVKKAFSSVTSKTQSPRSVSSGKNSSHTLTPILSIVPGWANSRNVQFSVIPRWCWLIFIPNNQINVLVETRLGPLSHTLSPSAPSPAAVNRFLLLQRCLRVPAFGSEDGLLRASLLAGGTERPVWGCASPLNTHVKQLFLCSDCTQVCSHPNCASALHTHRDDGLSCYAWFSSTRLSIENAPVAWTGLLDAAAKATREPERAVMIVTYIVAKIAVMI